jgi:protein-S-isoprenylcysteine O-methyltransferase Ste14
MDGLRTFEAAHRLRGSLTEMRLIASRLLGLSVLVLFLLGSSYWCSLSPLWGESLFFAGISLTVLGFAGRLWSLAYIAGRKKRVLVTAGPYALCRHPLYFSTLLAGVGVGLSTETFTAAVLFVLAFLAYYPYNIRIEEQFLLMNFDGYEEYQRRVPLFFPTWSRARSTGGAVAVEAAAFGREILAAAGFLLVPGVFELIEGLHEVHLLPGYFLIP